MLSHLAWTSSAMSSVYRDIEVARGAEVQVIVARLGFR
jgi:hypothetical protein